MYTAKLGYRIWKGEKATTLKVDWQPTGIAGPNEIDSLVGAISEAVESNEHGLVGPLFFDPPEVFTMEGLEGLVIGMMCTYFLVIFFKHQGRYLVARSHSEEPRIGTAVVD